MFISDTFASNKNETWWFGITRRTIATVFIGLLFFFIIIQFRNSLAFANLPALITMEPDSHVDIPGFVICPESIQPKLLLATIPQVDLQFSITCGYSFEIETISLNDIEITNETCSLLFTNEGNGCLRFRSNNTYVTFNRNYYNDEMFIQTKQGFNRTFMFFDIKPKNIQNPPNSYNIYFDEYTFVNFVVDKYGSKRTFSVSNRSYDRIEYNRNIIRSGRITEINYSLYVHGVFSSKLLGQLSSIPDIYSTQIKSENYEISLENNTKFILVPDMPHFTKVILERYEYTPFLIISSFGGFYSALITVYVLLLGMSKFEPWGLFQKGSSRFWLSQESFKGHLDIRYVDNNGIPLEDDTKYPERENCFYVCASTNTKHESGRCVYS